MSGRRQTLLKARVLDLSDERGCYCGKVFADLGADVIKVEPPGGDASRKIGPYYHDEHHLEKSLFWFYTNLNKRSITLDLQTPGGRDKFKKLVRTADLVIESFEPGYLDSIGLGYSELEKVNPGIILTSITPFGQTGPYSHFKATDIVLMAMGGMMAIQGDTDRPPVRISEPTAFFLGSLHAFTGSLIAYYHREITGEGQHVDASCQQAVVLAVTRGSEAWAMSRINSTRQGRYQVIPRDKSLGPLFTQRNFQCKDGYVNAYIMGGGQAAAVASSKALVELANENGMALELKNYDWSTLDTSKISQETLNDVHNLMSPFLLSKTKRELFEESIKRGILLAPINDDSDIMKSPELQLRRFFVPVKNAELKRTLHYASFPIRISGFPYRLQRVPPSIGQHTEEVLNELGSPEKPAGPRMPGPRGGQALKGVKVADFSRAASAPMAIRELAEHGAIVVRVDSHRNPDNIRFISPFKDGIPGIDRGAMVASYNTNKYCISLDLKHPEGYEVCRRLIKWADVVAENMRPGAMKQLGLDYESCKRIKPDIIYATASQMGQAIPYGGYGLQAASIAGFAHLLGWPDRGPVAPDAYPDFISPYFFAGAIVLSLDYRRKTGKGIYLDLSQVESGVALLGPALLDYEVNGRVANRRGNADPYMAPHGAYPCRGEDKWVVIAVQSDEQWDHLCRVLDRPQWAGRDDFKTVEGRRENQDELNKLVGAWTVNYSSTEVMRRMQEAGVPAGIVATGQDLFEDPQLRHREHFRTLVHKEIGPYSCHAPAYKFSKSPCEIAKAGPCLGEDNWYVYREMLGFSEDEIADLLAKGIITTEADIAGGIRGTY